MPASAANELRYAPVVLPGEKYEGDFSAWFDGRRKGIACSEDLIKMAPAFSRLGEYRRGLVEFALGPIARYPDNVIDEEILDGKHDEIDRQQEAWFDLDHEIDYLMETGYFAGKVIGERLING